MELFYNVRFHKISCNSDCLFWKFYHRAIKGISNILLRNESKTQENSQFTLKLTIGLILNSQSLTFNLPHVFWKRWKKLPEDTALNVPSNEPIATL